MEARKATELFKQADQLYRMRRYIEALAILDELDIAFPGHRNIMLPRARCLAKLNREQEALEVCDQIIEQFGLPRAKELKTRITQREKESEEAFSFDSLKFEGDDFIETPTAVVFDPPESWTRVAAITGIVFLGLLAQLLILAL